MKVTLPWSIFLKPIRHCQIFTAIQPDTLVLLGAGYSSLGIMGKIPGRKKIVLRVRSSNSGSTNAGCVPLKQCSSTGEERRGGERSEGASATVCHNVLQKLTQPLLPPPPPPLRNEVLVFGLECVQCGVLRD